MADIKEQLLVEGLDKKSANIYMGSWRPATLKQYDSYLEKWSIFCVENVIHPRLPSLIDVMKFLTWLSCDLDLSYSAVNSARSALSAYAQKIGGHPVGSHPEIVRHVKGISKSKPPKARVNTTWDVNTVFVLLKKWHPLADLSIQQLTFKTVMLLVLVLAQRAQTLALMRISGLTWLEERVLIEMKDLLKHNRVGQPLEVFQVSRYNKDKRLCPIRALREYVKVTKNRRGGSDFLWISLTKPYKGVSKDSISRWIRKTMGLAGIDNKVYSSHSTRSASTSKAKQVGLPVDIILNRARWTNATTFGRYYDKKIEDEHAYQDAILSAGL